MSRRTLLALGPAGLAAAVAGCAAAEPTDAPSNGPSDADTSMPSSGAAEPAPATTGKLQKLTTTDAVPVGGGRVVSGVLVVQLTRGSFKAFDARCPHLAAIVKPPKDGVIVCPIHGSKFADGDGSLLQGPATRGLKSIPITVDGKQIFIIKRG